MNLLTGNYLINIIRKQLENISVLEVLATICIFIIIVNLIWMLRERLGNHCINKSKKNIILILVIYSILTYYITFERRNPGTRYDINVCLDFGDIKGDFLAKQQFVLSVLNIFLFIPFGICGSLLKKEYSIISRVFLCSMYSFVISFMIEMAQLFTKRGYFEVSDLVTNTLGGLIGVLLVLICELFRKFRKQFKGDRL